MLSIGRRVRNLRVVRVYAPQNNTKAAITQQVPHAMVEPARPGPEIIVGQNLALCLVRRRQHCLDLLDLPLKLVIAQTARRLVAHSMITQLMPLRNQLPQYRLPSLNLLPDDEKSSVGVVFAQHLHNLVRVRRGSIIKRQRNDLLCRGGFFEEHVGELVAQVADEEARRLVDAVDGVERQGEQDEQGEEEHLRRQAVAADAAPEGGRQAEEVEARHWPGEVRRIFREEEFGRDSILVPSLGEAA